MDTERLALFLRTVGRIMMGSGFVILLLGAVSLSYAEIADTLVYVVEGGVALLAGLATASLGGRPKG